MCEFEVIDNEVEVEKEELDVAFFVTRYKAVYRNLPVGVRGTEWGKAVENLKKMLYTELHENFPSYVVIYDARLRGFDLSSLFQNIDLVVGNEENILMLMADWACHFQMVPNCLDNLFEGRIGDQFVRHFLEVTPEKQEFLTVFLERLVKTKGYWRVSDGYNFFHNVLPKLSGLYPEPVRRIQARLRYKKKTKF